MDTKRGILVANYNDMPNFDWLIPRAKADKLGYRPINGGPLVTASGLIFVAATTDDTFRAIDIKTGKVVWQVQLPAGGQATPMTYEVNGRQYVAIAPGCACRKLDPGILVMQSAQDWSALSAQRSSIEQTAA